MKTKKDFLLFRQTHLKEQMQKLEAVRLEGLGYIRRQWLVGVLGIVVFLVLMINIGKLHDWLAIILIFVFIVLYVYLLAHYTYKLRGLNFRRRFKQQLLAPTIKFISEDLYYHPLRCVPARNFVASRIFNQKITDYSGNDYVEGKIDKTAFHFSELFVSSHNKNNSLDTNDGILFQGLFFIADFHKDFKGYTLLVPRRRVRMKGISRFFKNKSKEVILEHPEIRKRFYCTSTDDVTARYILTPNIQSAISRFKKNYPRDDVFFSFIHNHVFVAISHGSDLFFPSFKESVFAETSLMHYFEEIALVVSLVEELNLNTRVWTRE